MKARHYRRRRRRSVTFCAAAAAAAAVDNIVERRQTDGRNAPFSQAAAAAAPPNAADSLSVSSDPNRPRNDPVSLLKPSHAHGMAPGMPDTWLRPCPTWQDLLEDWALRKQVFLLRVQLKVCRPCCFR